MNHTRVEWATASWNPVTGCTPVSAGCQHCYARRMATRLRGRYGYPIDEPFRVTLHPERLDEPLRWKKPQRVFVCSMGDLFHDDVPAEFVEDVFEVMSQCRQHTFLVLTKRPQNIQAKLYEQIGTSARLLGGGDFLPNVWFGVTAENQAAADERIPVLLQVPAAKRFVSCEPMLGPVDMVHIRPWHSDHGPDGADALAGGSWGHEFVRHLARDPSSPGYCHHSNAPILDLIIVGGETGPGARPMHPGWPMGLRDQCMAAGTPFFFKSWGDWCPESVANSVRAAQSALYIEIDGSTRPADRGPRKDAVTVQCVGKKAAGRLLDGDEWNESPEVTR